MSHYLKKPPWLHYSLALLFIATWWGLAFIRPSSYAPAQFLPAPQVDHPRLPFSSIDRAVLRHALDGDVPSMIQLIARWDAEAEWYEREGGTPDRLTRDEYIDAFRSADGAESLGEGSYFPQTYLACGILSALVEPKTITALPSGLRRQRDIYSEELISGVPLDADLHHMEGATRGEKTLSFISFYSDPSTVNLLQERGAELAILNPTLTFSKLSRAIEQVGTKIGNPRKGRLLSLFTKAAIYAINNRLKEVSTDRVLLLTQSTLLTLPTENTLLGHLVKELGLNAQFRRPGILDWSVPVEMEELIKHAPKTLILAKAPSQPPMNLPLEKNVFCIDKDLLDTPSQYIVLGYYDLYTILAGASFE